MEQIFKNVMNRIAQGDMEDLYARIGISLDCEELSSDGSEIKQGSVSIYSRNQIPIVGTIESLHPCITIDVSFFDGNSTIAYQITKPEVPYLEDTVTDGILIVYNGGEYVIPFHQLSVKKAARGEEVKNTLKAAKLTKRGPGLDPKDQELKKTKAALADITAKIFAGTDDENMIRAYAGTISLSLSKLIEAEPGNVRYLLYQAIYAMKMDNLNVAVRLESRLRVQVAAAKKTHFTDYCILLYLQCLICSAQRQEREAAVRKRQLIDYINSTLDYEAADPDLPLLLGSDTLALVKNSPIELWHTLYEMWEDGNNSPYLYILGARIIAQVGSGQLIKGDLNPFLIRCIREAIRRGMANEDMANAVARSMVNTYSPYIYKTMKDLYELFPIKEMLSTLTMISIRADLRNRMAFDVYKKALKEKLRIPRLYDYYVYSLPTGYDEPIPEDVIGYFAMDESIRSEILIKLCLNVSRFYRGHAEFRSRYLPEVPGLIRRYISKGKWNEDLALLAGEQMTLDLLDEEMAKSMIPLLYLVEVKGDVADGNLVLYENEIFSQPEKSVFQDGKCCIYTPGNRGSFHVTDKNGNLLNGIHLSVRSLIQDEELLERCQEICAQDQRVKTISCYENLISKNYDEIDFDDCMDLLIDSSLTEKFHRLILNYLLAHLSSSKDTDLSAICASAGLMDSMQLPEFMEYLIRKGHADKAFEYLPSISWSLLPMSSLMVLASSLSENLKEKEQALYSKLLLYLVQNGQFEYSHINWLADYMVGKTTDLLLAYERCSDVAEKKVHLSSLLLTRLILKEETNLPVLMDLVGAQLGDPLLSKAVVNRICYAYICHDETLSEGVLAVLQGMILYEGSVDGISLPCRLAMLKYDDEIGFKHDVVQDVLRGFLIDVIEKEIQLDFIATAAAKQGLYAPSVITADISRLGMTEESAKNLEEEIYAEYRVGEESVIYKVQAFQAYASLYSAQILQFAGEKVRYRFRKGDETTKWMPAKPYNALDLSIEGAEESEKERYNRLQRIALSLSQGKNPVSEVREYEKKLRLIRMTKNIEN